MMSNSNYSICIRLTTSKARSSHCVGRHLRAHQETVNALHWSSARDVNGRDRDVDSFSRDVGVRLESRDRDHNPASRRMPIITIRVTHRQLMPMRLMLKC